MSVIVGLAQKEYMKWGGYYSAISNSDESIKIEILKNGAKERAKSI